MPSLPNELARDEFTNQFRAAVEGMSWEDIARACKTSMCTVTRWYYGYSAPHPLGRASVFTALEKAKGNP